MRYAIKNNKKTIGIDVIYGNVGAGKVSGKLGFEYVDSVRIFHKAGGLERFHLYEIRLKKCNSSSVTDLFLSFYKFK